GVREARPHQGPQQQVVAARDHLPLGPADDPRAAGQPGADGQVAVPGQQRGDQRQQGVQVCRQIDIHVGEDLGLALRPDGPQRPAASRQLHPDGPDLRQLPSQLAGDLPGGVRAAVVRDGDPGAEGEALAQVAGQPAHARREITLLIPNRDNDIYLQNCHAMEDRRSRFVTAEATLCVRYEQRGLAAAPVRPRKSSYRTGAGASPPARASPSSAISRCAVSTRGKFWYSLRLTCLADLGSKNLAL